MKPSYPTANEDTYSIAGTSLSKIGLAHLFVVYLLWSSTYLAIRVAVEEGSGFPPFAMGGSRLVLAGLILFALTCLRKDRLLLTFKELSVVSVSGFLMWGLSNGLLIWAEQHTNSGLASLLISTTPMWVALFDSALSKRSPSLFLVGSIFLGLSGVAVLMLPVMRAGDATDFISGLLLVVASLSWAVGTVYQKRNPTTVNDTVFAAYQLFVGGCAYFIASWLLGEPKPHPTPGAWLAWGYLIVFGSVIAFNSYAIALRQLPLNVMMTYSFVNPVLAVVLGWLILGEQITGWTVVGATLVLLGVVGVFRQQTERFRA
jgi:drug/metabolite transporter (DMT)-like permease